ncbi:Hypothetical predicted protein [Olea europaea subsp. europaea]|uniref:Uncharacterized protein n=1 Tax=Olea europaea subsp. europaea TaxID=158383 RepID=A0A8S0VKB9_OLEEU|nr:Hypothetical predicted protein [Olea europaea subsp. europaea]
MSLSPLSTPITLATLTARVKDRQFGLVAIFWVWMVFLCDGGDDIYVVAIVGGLGWGLDGDLCGGGVLNREWWIWQGTVVDGGCGCGTVLGCGGDGGSVVGCGSVDLW